MVDPPSPHGDDVTWFFGDMTCKVDLKYKSPLVNSVPLVQ